MQASKDCCPYCFADSLVEGPSGWSCSSCKKDISIEQMPLQPKPSPAAVVTAMSAVPNPLSSDLQASTQCPICQDAQCNTSTPCGHSFCEACLTQWLRDHLTCPLCRNGMNPSHVVTYVPNNGDASELIIFNKINRTLSYGVRCRWLKDNQPCTGTFLQKYDIATGNFEPRNCRECRGATVPVPEAVKRLAKVLASESAPTPDEFGTAQSFPNEEQLVVNHSLPAGLTGFRIPKGLVVMIAVGALIFWVCYFTWPFFFAYAA